MRISQSSFHGISIWAKMTKKIKINLMCIQKLCTVLESRMLKRFGVAIARIMNRTLQELLRFDIRQYSYRFCSGVFFDDIKL